MEPFGNVLGKSLAERQRRRTEDFFQAHFQMVYYQVILLYMPPADSNKSAYRLKLSAMAREVSSRVAFFS